MHVELDLAPLSGSKWWLFICVTVAARTPSGLWGKERDCFLGTWWYVYVTQVLGRTNIEAFCLKWYVPAHLLGLMCRREAMGQRFIYLKTQLDVECEYGQSSRGKNPLLTTMLLLCLEQNQT